MVAASAAPGIGVRPAAAHEEVPGVRNVLDEVEPALPGVTVQVQTSAADQLVLENTGSTPLEVLDERGQPFLRIGPAGVEANQAAPAWYLSNSPTGQIAIPPDATPTAPARWVVVAADPSWGWFDHRLHQTILTAAPERRGRIESWKVPIRAGDRTAEIRGHREFAPPSGSFVARLTGPVPPGLTVNVAPGTVPAFFLTADPGAGDVVILGEEGEPFARLTAAGAEVNEASPSWPLTAASLGRRVEGRVGAQEPPRWTSVRPQRQLTWLERRAHYPEEEPPDAVRHAGQEADVADWSVPLTVAGTPATLTGVVRWIPAKRTAEEPPATGGDEEPRMSPLALFGAGAVVLGVLLALTVLRRRTPPPTR